MTGWFRFRYFPGVFHIAYATLLALFLIPIVGVLIGSIVAASLYGLLSTVYAGAINLESDRVALRYGPFALWGRTIDPPEFRVRQDGHTAYLASADGARFGVLRELRLSENVLMPEGGFIRQIAERYPADASVIIRRQR